MSTMPPSPRLPIPLSRAQRGRWLGGVCVGLAAARELSVGWVRVAFALAAVAGGLGVLVYLACWLIVPAEGDDAGAAASPRGLVIFAQTCAGCLGVATLGAVGAAATVFGFGWIVAALAAAILFGTLARRPRVGPAWVLLPTAALVLPSVALAAGGVRVAPQSGHIIAAPRVIGDVPRDGYRSGLGTMLVDLRRTAIPAGAPASLRIRAGVRRTIVALPHDRCVHVRLRYDQTSFVAGLAAAIADRSGPVSDVTVFGRILSADSGTGGNAAARGTGPTVNIDFRSAGGSLVVRDYPEDVDPDLVPDWPGYRVWPEERPPTAGTPRRAARGLVRHWRTRRRAQDRSARRIKALLPGPCATARGGR